MTVTVRRATPDDLPAIAVADSRAFGEQLSDEDLADLRGLLDPARFLVACEPDGQLVGVTGSFGFEVTLPGGARLPAPGVSWVSVALTHRRRGILRALLREQHRGFLADGAALALLTASEGGIYSRFGYGPATTVRSVELDRRRARPRPGAPDPGGVREVDAATARELAPDIHRRWAAATPGALTRSPAWWDMSMRDPERRRRGGSPLFHLLHPDGYACYRRHDDGTVCRVVDLFAVTGHAHAALWRLLLDMDLVDTVKAALAPDDPLPLLLTDPRQVATVRLTDGMWARVLDVPALLAARRYGVELDVVLQVDDPLLDRGGRLRLRGGPDGATCERSGSVPDVELGIDVLGALLLGSGSARAFAGAGRLVAGDPGLLGRLDLALRAEREPVHGTGF